MGTNNVPVKATPVVQTVTPAVVAVETREAAEQVKAVLQSETILAVDDFGSPAVWQTPNAKRDKATDRRAKATVFLQQSYRYIGPLLASPQVVSHLRAGRTVRIAGLEVNTGSLIERLRCHFCGGINGHATKLEQSQGEGFSNRLGLTTVLIRAGKVYFVSDTCFAKYILSATIRDNSRCSNFADLAKVYGIKPKQTAK